MVRPDPKPSRPPTRPAILSFGSSSRSNGLTTRATGSRSNAFLANSRPCLTTECPSPQDLEEDLKGAIADFNESLARDPAFVESKIGAASCFGYLAYLSMKDPARMQEMIQNSSSFLKDAMASDPDNPRLLWVLGPIRWSSPPERGGGQDKAFDLYQRGLEAVRTRPAVSDPLEPSWGEPELLMNRAWSSLHRTTPDLKAAQNDAAAALILVPYWHYVRDILLPQIQDAQAKAR